MTPLSAPLALVTSDSAEVRSDLLGTLAVRPEHIITFSRGLLGFPECRRFALLRGGSDSVYWLQSLEYSSLLFLLVDPFPYFSDYAVEVSSHDVAALGATSASEVAILAIVTLPDAGAQPTVNLQGPVAINMKARRGEQIVCAEGDYGIRRPITLAAG